ncbi:MAG: FtsW/RodA/SpoVE family cell cycle protein [Clostridia bacterium]|nr:FtsW/RodA/SpoVE family cell cycle protein [Clostridia bacterium]
MTEEQNRVQRESIWNVFMQRFKEFVLPELKQSFSGLKVLLSPKSLFKFGLFDVTYCIVVFALTVMGLSMQYSASYKTSKQLIFAIMGLIIMVVISQLNVEAIKQLSNAAMLISTILLFVVFAAPEVAGTHRWFFGKLFQPSEIAKVTFVMFLAYLIDKYKSKKDKPSAFKAFLAITVVYALLVLMESHLSGCILFLCIGYAMMWYADLSRKWFTILTVIAIAGATIIVLKPEWLKQLPLIHDYQVDRIVIWKKVLFNSETITAKEKLNNARQVLQSIYGIGSGGLTGAGYGNSGQKISNLQEASNDFVFAVIGEEFGFIGSVLIMGIYALLVGRGFYIATKSKSYYGALIVLGISTQMALQVLINISVATSLLPNTGISLPFVSSGGSSMVFTLASMGLVLAVSKDVKNTKGVKKHA